MSTLSTALTVTNLMKETLKPRLFVLVTAAEARESRVAVILVTREPGLRIRDDEGVRLAVEVTSIIAIALGGSATRMIMAGYGHFLLLCVIGILTTRTHKSLDFRNSFVKFRNFFLELFEFLPLPFGRVFAPLQLVLFKLLLVFFSGAHQQVVGRQKRKFFHLFLLFCSK